MGQGAAIYGRRLALPEREVRLMWKRRLYIVLRFLVCLILAMYILTINAR
jgi:hypothetical protein